MGLSVIFLPEHSLPVYFIYWREKEKETGKEE